MKLIPYSTFVIHTQLSKEQIKERLEKVTSARKSLLFWGVTTPFAGNVNISGFKVEDSGYRKKGYHVRNSFQAINSGEYKETETGVDVTVTQRLDPIIVILVVVTVIILALLSLMILASGEIPYAFVPIGMIFIVMFMLLSGFNSSMNKTRKMLEEVLEQEL